ncbi:MAG: DUF4357 domain-containing protein [Bacteroidota bacterium]|nr:DUF4357 domain-containing protein [Bacteroidota bacterium]
MGRSTNGWTKWKNKEGKTIDEIYRVGEDEYFIISKN